MATTLNLLKRSVTKSGTGYPTPENGTFHYGFGTVAEAEAWADQYNAARKGTLIQEYEDEDGAFSWRCWDCGTGYNVPTPNNCTEPDCAGRGPEAYVAVAKWRDGWHNCNVTGRNDGRPFDMTEEVDLVFSDDYIVYPSAHWALKDVKQAQLDADADEQPLPSWAAELKELAQTVDFSRSIILGGEGNNKIVDRHTMQYHYDVWTYAIGVHMPLPA